MKPTVLLSTSLLSLTAQAQLLPFIFRGEPIAHQAVEENKAAQNQRHQYPMDNTPGIQLPPADNNDKPSGDNGRPTGDVILSDVLGTQPQLNIFAGFTRDIASVSARLDNSGKNATVLAPLNRAITSLPRKPWEDPRDGANAYEGPDGEDRAHANLRRFTEAHIIPVSPWEEGVKERSLGGGMFWWEKKAGGKIVIMPGSVEVEGVVSRVANGEVWALKGVLNYAS